VTTSTDARRPLVTGRVRRVNGPVVHLTGLGTPARLEFVEVGRHRLPGEIISLSQDEAVAQVYEHTGGLQVGEPAWAAGRPLSVRLAPGLLGGIYDGLLRPLSGAEDFLGRRGLTRPPATTNRFVPLVEPGAEVGPGDVLGEIAGGAVRHLLLVPPEVVGQVEWVAEGGDHGPDEELARVAGQPVRAGHDWPIRRPRPATRLPETQPFHTGQRAIDLLEPITAGSSATVIGGFGEGKTMLLEQVAKWGDADVIVYVGCGERGNELADLIDELEQLTDPRTGRGLVERTLILANTSNMPVMAREASIYTAMTVAEYYRDMGLHAVIIADSTSRWAEARRELSSRTGAVPAEHGYPPDLPASLAAFYQRAGRVTTPAGATGAVTIVTSVSPPGGDVTEPVSAHTQRFVQAVWALDRELAYARHYPAVSWQRSFSRDVDSIARWYAAHGDPGWGVRRARLLALMAEADRLRGIADLVGRSAMPAEERVTMLGADLVRTAVLQQSALSEHDATCAPAKQAALLQAALDVYDEGLALVRAGAPATLLESFDLGPLVRAKDELGADDAEGVARVADRLLAGLRGLAP
jgi:V/A-type H+/Na+-transporting ATPase subunit A